MTYTKIPNLTRCDWVPPNDKIYTHYHDKEWGRPIKCEKELFSKLIQEGQQAGLSWSTVLHKRQNLLLAYDNFDPDILSGYDNSDYERLMTDPKIIRSKLKVNAAVFNAKIFIHMRDKEQINFSDYLWGFIDYKPIQNNWYGSGDIPSHNSLSFSIAADLKKRGFKFVGPVIIYAFMQAVGMINDHTLGCFANKVCKDLS